MKPYPRYKTIGLPWLDKIPAHWNVFRNKNFLHERKSLVGDNASSYTLLSLTLNGVIPRDMENPTGKFPSDFSTYKAVEPGDMVFCLFDMDETPRTVGLSNLAGMVTGAYDVFSVSGANPRFLYYYYLSIDNTKSLKPYYSGLRKVVPPSRFLGIPMPLPPPSEQDRIVCYLDEKMAAIDELVRAKEREIELLRERKQAIISEAVIAKNISTKCPLGCRLKELVCFFKGLNITKADLIPEGANVISYGQIHSKENDGRSLKDSFLRHTSFELTNDAARLSCGDIVFADTSEDQAGIGNCVLNDRHDPVWAGYHTVTARPSNPEIAPYLAILFQSNWWRDQLRRSSDGVKVYSITQHSLGNTKVVLPPLPEQRRIVAHLDAVCSRIDSAEAAIRKQITLLQELRTRLVSDAVTGAFKIP